MSTWESKTVSDTIKEIDSDIFVLPIIQRRLVWNEEKIELIFDTLLKGNSFGGIMVLEEERGNEALFEHREFSLNGSLVKSKKASHNLHYDQYFVIDGQQRLQSFYLGLKGSYKGKLLYYNLNSNYADLEFDFKFINDPQKLPPKKKNDNGATSINVWYPVTKLFSRLKKTNNDRQVTEEIATELKIDDSSIQKSVGDNIWQFYRSVFNNSSIGISKVIINRSLDKTANKQRIVELFRRLNDGGTKLSAFDLVASILKGFEWEMESFLDKIIAKYQSIGISQDEIIKLIFILQNDNKKQLVDISAADAEFAIKNKARIENSLKATENFLHTSKLYEYFKTGNRSTIPLYFIAYNLFYKKVSDEEILTYYNNFDVNNEDYIECHKWIYTSLLNGVFKSRGAGWIPYKTGVRKILEVMKSEAGNVFPREKIYKVYREHPLNFFQPNIKEEHLDFYDPSFIYYLIYEKQRVVRLQDEDHIHPRHILEKKGIDWEKINSIANFQLLDYGTNRGIKSDKELYDWISNYIKDKRFYLKRHVIPEDETLWKSDNFLEFIERRKSLIVSQLESNRHPD